MSGDPTTDSTAAPSPVRWFAFGLAALLAGAAAAYHFAPRAEEPVARAPKIDFASELDQGREAFNQRRWDDARVHLQQIPQSAPQSAEARALLARIQPAETQILFEQAHSAIARGDFDRAAQLQKQVSALDAALGDRLLAELAEHSGTTQVLPPIALGIDRVGPEASVHKAFAPAFALFNKGDAEGASRELSKLAASSKDGTLAAAGRALAQAARQCAQAMAVAKSGDVDGQLLAARTCAEVDPSGAMQTAVRKRLASAYSTRAQAQLAGKHAFAALDDARHAQAADSSDADAAKVIAALASQAAALADQAQKEADPAKSRELWQVVATVAPSGDALRGRALAALQQ